MTSASAASVAQCLTGGTQRARINRGAFTVNQPPLIHAMTTVAITPTTRLKKADVCAELGISSRTLDNLVQRNEFPPGVRIGKWCYWSSKVLDNYRERAFNLQERWTPLSRRSR